MKNLQFLYLSLTAIILEAFGSHIEETSQIEQSRLRRSVGNIYRLPKTIWPLHYVIRLHPILEGNFTLSGSVAILLDVRESTNTIIFHIDGLTIREKTLKVVSAEDGQEVEPLAQKYLSEYQFYVVHLQNYLTKGVNYHINAEFHGHLSSDLSGFYLAQYTDPNGARRYLAATQFQPTYARKAFPCFDEPEIRATFDVILVRRKEMVALSNMPLKKSVNISEEWTEDHFDRSVPMSTYLLAFVIADLVEKPVSTSSFKTKLKIWARKERIAQADFAAEVAEKGLSFLEDYFNLEFPLPKLDNVAVPQMGPNGMENWGLIIYRESGLLHVPGEGSVEHMKFVAYLISHELAHQWFGNIVTMKWWTDLWLNEGFATYVGFRVVNEVRPSWEIMKTFVVTVLQGVMKLDELENSTPVRVVVNHPDEIEATFSKISYLKGGSILRMMKHFLGEKTFRKGLNLYLRELKYKCSEQDDLWLYMTKAAHEDERLPLDLTVKEIMDTWTLQAGFPILHVNRSNNAINLSQGRFLINPKLAKSRELAKLWWIPVGWVAQSSPHFHATLPKFWMNQRSHTFELNISQSDWILMNPKQNGFYRVSYDEENWAKLIRQLRSGHRKIHPISRAQLIDDALNLAKVGQFMQYETALDLLSYLKHEEHPIPWTAALTNLALLDKLMQHTSHYGPFRDYILSLISPLYETLVQEDPQTLSVLQMSLRESLIKWACHLDHHQCVKDALASVDKWRQNPHNNNSVPVPVDISEAVFCTTVRNGGSTLWDFMWEKYLSSSVVAYKEALFNSLACSKHVWILQRFLETALINIERKLPTGVPLEDFYKIYGQVANNPIGVYIAWYNIKEHWIKIKDIVGFGLAKVVENSLGHFMSGQMKEELNAFKKRYSGHFASAETAIRQAIEKTEANIAWRQKSLRPIVIWLQKQNFTAVFNLEQFEF